MAIKLTLTVDDENVTSDDLIRAINANSAFGVIDNVHQKLRYAINKGYPFWNSKDEVTEEERQVLEKVLAMIDAEMEGLQGKY